MNIPAEPAVCWYPPNGAGDGILQRTLQGCRKQPDTKGEGAGGGHGGKTRQEERTEATTVGTGADAAQWSEHSSTE